MIGAIVYFVVEGIVYIFVDLLLGRRWRKDKDGDV